jgi:hypothetical protein
VIKPQAISRLAPSKLRLLAIALCAVATSAFAQERREHDSSNKPFVVPWEKWDDRFAKAIGLSPADRYAGGVLRFSRASPSGRHLLLEIAELIDDEVLFRRIEAEGANYLPEKVIRATERKVKAPFRDIAFAMLDKLTAQEERAGVVATGVRMTCTSDHGAWTAVSVETRGEFAQSLTRYHSCRGSVQPPGGLEALGVKVPPTPPPYPKDPVLEMEAMFEGLFARHAAREMSGK